MRNEPEAHLCKKSPKPFSRLPDNLVGDKTQAFRKLFLASLRKVWRDIKNQQNMPLSFFAMLTKLKSVIQYH